MGGIKTSDCEMIPDLIRRVLPPSTRGTGHGWLPLWSPAVPPTDRQCRRAATRLHLGGRCRLARFLEADIAHGVVTSRVPRSVRPPGSIQHALSSGSALDEK